MKFLTVISKGCYEYDYDSYFKSLMKIKHHLNCDFLNEYIKRGYFHDYYVKNIELSAYEKGKSCVLLKLSENYRDSGELVTLKYINVESVEYFNERGYLDDYLYGEITYDGKHLKHEILLGDGKLNIIFESISILHDEQRDGSLCRRKKNKGRKLLPLNFIKNRANTGDGSLC